MDATFVEKWTKEKNLLTKKSHKLLFPKTLNILRCFFSKFFFSPWGEKKLIFCQNERYTFSQKFFETSLECSDQFLTIFEVLTQKKNFLLNSKIWRSKGPNFEKTLNILLCFLRKNNFFFMRNRKLAIFSKWENLHLPNIFFGLLWSL